MTAAYYDDVIEQGATFVRTWQMTDPETAEARDLTGYTARMTVRRRKNEPAPILELTVGNGRVSVTPLSGLVQFVIEAEDTATFDFSGAVYDCELVLGDVVERFLEGKMNLSREATK